MRIGNIFLLAACLLLSACESAPSSAPAASLQQIKTLGIISSLGTQLHYERIGANGWDNDFYTVAGSELGIDSYVVDLVAKQMAGRFDVRKVAYRPADFAPTEDDTTETMAAKIRSVQPANLDAYLLVLVGNSTSKSSGQTWDFSSQQISGFGLTRKSATFTHDYWAHALYVVVMVDGHTGKVLSETGAPGGYQKLGLIEFPAMGGPYKDVDETFWPEDPANPPPALPARLVNETLKPLFAESLQPTLKEANLLP